MPNGKGGCGAYLKTKSRGKKQKGEAAYFGGGLYIPDNVGEYSIPYYQTISVLRPKKFFKLNSACNKQDYLMLLRAPSPRLIEQYVPTK